jgi:hypothetical protein
MIEHICYFEDSSKWRENTAQLVGIVAEVAEREKVQHVVVASSTGYTAAQFAQGLDLTQVSLVGVKMSSALDSMYDVAIDADAVNLLDQKGVALITGTHVLTGGIDHSLSEKLGGLPPGKLIAHVLYLFCQGMKVAPEVAAMAVDAGLVPEGALTIAVAGTGSGADTALLLRAASSTNFFDLQILKILAKPL